MQSGTAPAIAGRETYAQLLRRAVQRPESLSLADRARIEPADRKMLVEALDFHIEQTDADLARRARMKRTGQLQPRASIIGTARWAHILTETRAGRMRTKDLTVAELRAIDSDPAMSAQYDAALFPLEASDA